MLVTMTLLTGCMAALGSVATSSVGEAVLGSIMEDMVNSVLNGQIGSKLTPTDQNFRLQHLDGMVDSGNVKQAQQWTNPQTGSTIEVNPVGQYAMNEQTQQQCQNLEESVTLPNGQTIRETRVACMDAKTGEWRLIK